MRAVSGEWNHRERRKVVKKILSQKQRINETAFRRVWGLSRGQPPSRLQSTTRRLVDAGRTVATETPVPDLRVEREFRLSWRIMTRVGEGVLGLGPGGLFRL
jgi:hypothetical protein